VKGNEEIAVHTPSEDRIKATQATHPTQRTVHNKHLEDVNQEGQEGEGGCDSENTAKSSSSTTTITTINTSANMAAAIMINPIVPIEEFFHDEPSLPWQPLPLHNLEQSSCYPIIGRNNNNGLYFCSLHPEFKNVYLDSIEQHCKYKDPDYHKSEILKLMSTKSPDNELAA
jgi:hypothetical protein